MSPIEMCTERIPWRSVGTAPGASAPRAGTAAVDDPNSASWLHVSPAIRGSVGPGLLCTCTHADPQ